MIIQCGRCGVVPALDPSIQLVIESEGVSPEEWIRQEEGTFQPDTGLYACDSCYIALGEPSHQGRHWRFGDLSYPHMNLYQVAGYLSCLVQRKVITADKAVSELISQDYRITPAGARVIIDPESQKWERG